MLGTRKMFPFHDVITNSKRHGVLNHRQIDCLFNSVKASIKENTEALHFYGSFVRVIHRSPVDSPRKASNAESVSMPWRHHGNSVAFRMMILIFLCQKLTFFHHALVCPWSHYFATLGHRWLDSSNSIWLNRYLRYPSWRRKPLMKCDELMLLIAILNTGGHITTDV